MSALFRVFLLIVLLIIVIKLKAAKELGDVTGIQSFSGIPQPLILNDNNVIIVQINFNYCALDINKVRKAKKNNSNICRILELIGIKFLRVYADEIANEEEFRNGYNKLENTLTNLLIEEGKKQGIEVTGLYIKIGDKSEFESFIKNDTNV